MTEEMQQAQDQFDMAMDAFISMLDMPPAYLARVRREIPLHEGMSFNALMDDLSVRIARKKMEVHNYVNPRGKYATNKQ